jgi:hypothetical protein
LQEAALKLEELRRVSEPRRINVELFKKELGNTPQPDRVDIWYVPELSDGLALAQNIFIALVSGGWQRNVGPPVPVPKDQPGLEGLLTHLPAHVAAGGLLNGISVVANGSHPSQDGLIRALMAALADGKPETTWSGVGRGNNTFVPEDTVRIVIGPKPDLYKPLNFA